MKTPPQATRMATPRAGARREAVLTPWGELPQRVVVSPEMPPTAARAALKARARDDCPEGKAVARRRHFERQRGLADEAATRGAAPQRARRAVANSSSILRAASLQPASSFAARAAVPAWRDLGPTLIPHGQTYGSGPGSTPSVSGRVSGVIVDRANPGHLVVCSAGGGLWGSEDRGATWVPLTDAQPSLVMGAIAQSASAPAVVYAATGDGDGGVPYGVGLLRSSDGGRTWTLVPSAALTGAGCYDLAVDPADPLRVWVATGDRLLRSANGGQTVQVVRNGRCWSVSVHPRQPAEVLAAFEDGLMRSSDGGATWARVALPGTGAATVFERLEVCHAPSQPDVVWVAGCSGGVGRLWRRAAAGGAFAALNMPGGLDTGQAWYDWCLAVSPHDPELVFLGAIDLFRGRRGAAGMSWANVSSRGMGDSIHPDQHFLAFDAAAPSVVYACNDGGLYRSADHGGHWVSLNPGLGITEFEFLAQIDSRPAWLFGGTQDNGSLCQAGPRLWEQVALGDGGDCAAVDRGAASIVYHSYYNMPIERAAALGPQAFAWADVSPPVPGGYASLFYPPLEARGRLLAKAGASLWVSADEGANWDEVSLPGPAQDLATALALIGEHTVLVGTESGRLWRAARGSGSWAQAQAVLLTRLTGAGYISDIAVVGSTARTVWLSCSRLGGAHVLRSRDGGKTFVDRSGDLPDLAVNALVVDPARTTRVYLATDLGVWRSTNSGGHWAPFGNGLPNVIVGDLILNPTARLLRAGTRARGAWEIAV